MTTVYLVTTGCYSDYAIRGAFSTREAADAECRKYGYAGDVEELELDADIDNRLPPGMWPWRIDMDKDGATTYWQQESVDDYRPEWFPRWEPGGATKPGRVHFFVMACDVEHAVKIANEMRVQLIASGEWTTEYRRTAYR